MFVVSVVVYIVVLYIAVFIVLVFCVVKVQNGVATYAAWASISTLMSLSVVLENQTATSKCDCAMFSLMVLLMELLAW